jgi:ATP-dependent DNA helicase RecG
VRQLVELEVQVSGRTVAGARLLLVTVEPAAVLVADTSRRFRRRQGRDCQEMRPAELGSFSVERRGVDWSAVATAASLDDVAPGALAQLRAWLRESSERSRLDLATSADRACCTSLVSPTSRVGSTAPASCSASGSPGERPHRPHVSAAAGAETELRLDDPEQPLAVAPAAVEDAIALHNPQYRLPGRLARGLTRALPELALREALVNAVAHRDWSAPATTRVQLGGLILAVTSHGDFLPGVTAETVITAPPPTRNAQLARALRSLRPAEAEGIGVDPRAHSLRTRRTDCLSAMADRYSRLLHSSVADRSNRGNVAALVAAAKPALVRSPRARSSPQASVGEDLLRSV